MKITTYQLEQTQVETVSDETSEKPIMAKTILFVASQNGSSTMNNTDSSVSITGTVTIYYSVVQVKATAC